PLEARTAAFQRARRGGHVTDYFLRVQRYARRALARIAAAGAEAPLPCSKRKRARERKGTPPASRSPRSSQEQNRSLPSQAEFRRRNSHGVLRRLGCREFLVFARICPPDRFALPGMAACADSGRTSARCG